MDHKCVVILMLPCFLFMVATLSVSPAAVNYSLLKVHSCAHVSGQIMIGGLSNDRTDSSSDEFSFNGRALLDEKSDESRFLLMDVLFWTRRVTNQEKGMLKLFKSDPSGKLSNWTAENSQQVCSWYGITCRRVVAVIPDTMMILNSSLGNLSLLHTLHLAGNYFTGGIPPELGKLKALRRLDLFFEQLHISPTLSIPGNNFSGLFFSIVDSMRSLSYLDWSENNFSGPLPSTLSYMTNLSHLDLWSNNFTGALPSTLSYMTNLSYLVLGLNYFSGPIP